MKCNLNKIAIAHKPTTKSSLKVKLPKFDKITNNP